MNWVVSKLDGAMSMWRDRRTSCDKRGDIKEAQDEHSRPVLSAMSDEAAS